MGRQHPSPVLDSTSVEVEALREAIGKIGSQSATARLLKVTQGAVSKWLSGKKPLPAKHVLIVEAETGVAKERLRPDIYPAVSPAIDVVRFGNLEPAR